MIRSVVSGIPCLKDSRNWPDSLFRASSCRALGPSTSNVLTSSAGVEDARYTARVAEADRSLGFFPKATFTRMPGLLPFHVGAFAAIAQAGMPVVPVIIRGTRSLLRAESWFPRRIVVKIHVSAPIVPAGREWTAAVKLRDTARDAVLQQPGEPDLEQKAPPI